MDKTGSKIVWINDLSFMKKLTFKFSHSTVDYYLDSRIAELKKVADPKATVLVTDENIYKAHPKLFTGWNTIILQPGEEHKVQSTADELIEELIDAQAGRTTTLVGIGGGVITDITGYVASVYMRGLRFGFVPTSLLGLVDASIGGKNGIDVGVYKNMVGTIRQPAFIFHDLRLLSTLPEKEWENGFAEIIKHACIRDQSMFSMLENNNPESFRRKKQLLSELVERNALLKTRIVQRDEFEKSDRRLLNFGHTLGHALENQYDLMHGHAVSIGMGYACRISEKMQGFKQTDRVLKLLDQYKLPFNAAFDKQKAFEVLKMDKKRVRKEINYVLLNRIGQAIVRPILLSRLEKMIKEF